MVNKWIEHIKEYSKRNNITYGCALSLKECKDEYNNKNVKHVKEVKEDENNNNNIYDMKKIYLFDRKGNLLYNNINKSNLIKSIKENNKSIDKDIKVFLIRFKFDINNNDPLIISLSPYTITTKQKLIMDFNNEMINIIYNKDEYNKYGFNNNHIDKIIKAIRTDKVSYKDFRDNITNILK